MSKFTRVGLDALLTPENCVLVLIDHQAFQLANVNSHEPTMVINNVTALAKTAKAFEIPTILTTVNEDRGGHIFRTVQAVFPNQKAIDRTFINAWEDDRVVEAVKKTGRRKIVFAALWSEMCLAMPVIHAMGDGYDVYIVTDASGGVSEEAHDMAIRRLVAAGAQPITWLGMAGELQRQPPEIPWRAASSARVAPCAAPDRPSARRCRRPSGPSSASSARSSRSAPALRIHSSSASAGPHPLTFPQYFAHCHSGRLMNNAVENSE